MDHQVIRLGAAFDRSAKDYVWSLRQHGLEMGTGSAGSYEEHAHRHFVDLIYSPGRLRVPQLETPVPLLVVEPGVRFGPTSTGDFFFLKFLPSGAPYSIPDKVVGDDLAGYSHAPGPSGYAPPWSETFTYYAPTDDREFQLSIRLLPASLELESSAGWTLSID